MKFNSSTEGVIIYPNPNSTNKFVLLYYFNDVQFVKDLIFIINKLN